jgi:hypothetical protein
MVRLEHFNSVDLFDIDGDDVLRPRARDLLRVLAAPVSVQAVQQGLLKFFESGQACPPEPLDPEQSALLYFLFEICHKRVTSNEPSPPLTISELTKQLNDHLKGKGAIRGLKERRVGSLLTSLGFPKRRRTKTGYIVDITQQDAERIHQLAAIHGIDGFTTSANPTDTSACSLCKASGLDKELAPSDPNDGDATN